MAFHDLTSGKIMPRSTKAVLGLGNKFIVTPDETWTEGVTDSNDRFERDVDLKVFFEDSPLDHDPPPLYIKSQWRPPPAAIPVEVNRRLADFFRGIRALFVKRRGISNLLPFQRKILFRLRRNMDIVIANTDKGLGPCAIEYSRYVCDALKHLTNAAAYEFLDEHEAMQSARETVRDINKWLFECRKSIDDHARQFIAQITAKNCDEEPFGQFYLLYKVHKPSLKTRPVVSDCASIINPIGKWVDTMLQPFSRDMPTYFKDSFALKKILDETVVPARARLFSCDAEAMYNNIDTDDALATIAAYLRDSETERRFDHYSPECLIRAIEIVMRNNIIRFGDLYVRQTSGTAMGVPPAPPYANIFEGLHEIDFLPLWKARLPLYKRFLDDVIGLWLPSSDDPSNDDAEWANFQAVVNSKCLTWVFTERGMSVDFMDLTVTIAGDAFHTTLYEKPMALYLYIPPHSAHPPGVRNGHIFGEVLRIHRLCSDEDDITERILTFFRRMTQRGHTRSDLLPVFQKALCNARKFLATSDDEREAAKAAKLEAACRRVYYHVEYHPQGPTSRDIQRLFDECIMHPPGRKRFPELGYTPEGIPLDEMIVCYHRPLNLGNLFSYRKISKRDGPPASSFL